MPLNDVALVTRNYNNYKMTLQCILDLKESSDEEIGQIIVVDDCSTDNSVMMLKKSLPEIKIIEMTRFSEYCICFNKGVEAAIDHGAEFIQIVNNDTKTFTTNFVDHMKKKFEEHPKLGVVGSLVYDYEKNVRTSGEGFQRYGIFVDIPTEGFMVSRKVVSEIGLFDPKLVRHLEDYDFLIRMRKAGYWSTNCNQASFDHLGGGTSKKMVWVPNYYRMRNIIWFLKRHGYEYSFLQKLRIIYGFSNKSRMLAKQDLQQKKPFRGMAIITAALCGALIGIIKRW